MKRGDVLLISVFVLLFIFFGAWVTALGAWIALGWDALWIFQLAGPVLLKVLLLGFGLTLLGTGLSWGWEIAKCIWHGDYK